MMPTGKPLGMDSKLTIKLSKVEITPGDVDCCTITFDMHSLKRSTAEKPRADTVLASLPIELSPPPRADGANMDVCIEEARRLLIDMLNGAAHELGRASRD